MRESSSETSVRRLHDAVSQKMATFINYRYDTFRSYKYRYYLILSERINCMSLNRIWILVLMLNIRSDGIFYVFRAATMKNACFS
jgi:hypothetical protein